jgi:GT2 family glycosyltransferase
MTNQPLVESSETSFALCSVLFGNKELPPFTRNLPASCKHIILVDNSADLTEIPTDERIRILRPPSNVGFSGGVNLALRDLLSLGMPEVVVVASPDMALQQSLVNRLVDGCASVTSRICYPSADAMGVGLVTLPRPISSSLAVLTRLGIFATARKVACVPSGALLAFNRSSLLALALPGGGLLDEHLFSMDDADLYDRAVETDVELVAVAAMVGEVNHPSAGTAWRAPSVSYYFRRASKVRYWRKRNNVRGIRFYEVVMKGEAKAILLISWLAPQSRVADFSAGARYLLLTGGMRFDLDSEIFALANHDPSAA